jgi:cytochrome c553
VTGMGVGSVPQWSPFPRGVSLGLKAGVCGAGVVLAFAGLMIGAEAAQTPPGALPLWAYPVSSVVTQSAAATNGTGPGDTQIEHVPGSTAGYTAAQLADLFAAPDWFPGSHLPMPAVVEAGRKPDLFACGHCHLPNGQGRPENQSIVGLPAAYIEQQVADFRNGLRYSSEPRMISVSHMIMAAKAATPEEIKEAASYFSSLKPQRWIRVVETDTVPATHPVGGMLVVDDPASVEPIGERVIEVSEDLEQTELRNPTSGFVAYVPRGSLAVGESLVKTGGHGRIMACTVCHGQSLKGQYMKGMGMVPTIAGRSPSQMARQLIDFQRGARHGANSGQMRILAKKLSSKEIVAITGYLASLNP